MIGLIMRRHSEQLERMEKLHREVVDCNYKILKGRDVEIEELKKKLCEPLKKEVYLKPFNISIKTKFVNGFSEITYVVRQRCVDLHFCNIHTTWRDEQVFNTLDEAKRYIAEAKKYRKGVNL